MQTATLNTLRDFVHAVDALTNIDDAYYVFEDRCSESLRASIYALADTTSPEPFRSAMHVLGYTNY